MGLKSTSDNWCALSDLVIIGSATAQKIVDDILVTGCTADELVKEVEAVLTNCRRHGITISKRKFRMAEEVSFAGYTVNSKGISPDPKRVEAIREFPTPQDITGVWSFLGLVNQL